MDQMQEEEIEKLLQVIGFVTVNWARIEREMDNVVSVALRVGGKEFEKVRPRTLDRKITFLKKCFERLPLLEPFQERALPLIDDVKINKNIRHNFTHGIIDSIRDSTLIMRKIKFLKGYDYTVQVAEINLEALPDFATGIAHLGVFWGQLAENLVKLSPEPE